MKFAIAFLPVIFGAAPPLIFDHRRLIIPHIKLTQTDQTQIVSADSVPFQHFARTQIYLPVEAEDVGDLDLVILVEVQGASETPILLLHGKVFGGDHRIPFDTSNFCEWLTHPGVPQNGVGVAYLVVPLKPRVLDLKKSRTLLFYIGFTSPEARNKSYNVTIETRLTAAQERHVRACDLFRGPQSLSKVHLARSVGLGQKVTVETKDLIVPDWSAKNVEIINAQLKPTKVVSLALGLPKEKVNITSQGMPALKVKGSVNRMAVMAGPLAAQSVWELERLSPMATDVSERGLISSEDHVSQEVAFYPLKSVIDHVRNRDRIYAPPTVSLSILLFATTENDLPVSVQPLLIPPNFWSPMESKDLSALHTANQQGRSLLQLVENFTVYFRLILFESLAFVGLLVVCRSLWNVALEMRAKADYGSAAGEGGMRFADPRASELTPAAFQRLAETTPLIVDRIEPIDITKGDQN